ncbi:hypothetical protein BGP_0801 [Beggiatoa sp. PS]|nr:hypothetical protein BGP_0801 [Beggiatoa sp. PS]
MKIELVDKSTGKIRWQICTSESSIVLHNTKEKEWTQIELTAKVEVKNIVEHITSLCIPHSYVAVFAQNQNYKIKTLAEGIVALFIARHFASIISMNNGVNYHVVLAHAFPLAFIKGIYEHTVQYLPQIVHGNQLLFLDQNQLILVDPSHVPRENIESRHRRVVRINSKCEIRRTTPTTEIIKRWSSFCEWRFHDTLNTKHLNLLKTIFSALGFTVKEFWLSDQCMVQSLIYFDHEQRILFDVLAPWQPKHSANRPGIYSAVHNLLESHQLNARYCLCYGIYPYKQEIIRGLPNVDLQKI